MAGVDAIAITHFHLDHWGDLVPWVWGRMYGLGRDLPTPELWVQSGGREELELFGEHFGMPDMFERTFDVREYDEDEAFEAAGLRIKPVRLPHYTLRTFGFRVSNGDGPSPTRATLARASGWPSSRATSISSCARRRSSAASWTGSRADTSRWKKRARPTRHRARSACCSRTGPRSYRWIPGSSRPTTASSSPSDGGRTPSTHAVRAPS